MTTKENNVELRDRFIRDLNELLIKYSNPNGTKASISAELDDWGSSCSLNVYLPSNDTSFAGGIDFNLPWNEFEAGDGVQVIASLNLPLKK